MPEHTIFSSCNTLFLNIVKIILRYYKEIKILVYSHQFLLLDTTNYKHLKMYLLKRYKKNFKKLDVEMT